MMMTEQEQPPPPRPAAKRVFDTLDILSTVAVFLGEVSILPFASTSKNCYIATKATETPLRSKNSNYCSSTPLLCWALGQGCLFDARLLKQTWLYAVRHGRLEVLEALRYANGSGGSSKVPNKQSDKYWSNVSLCREAAAAGGFETLRWLRTQHPPAPYDESVLQAAAAAGNLQIVQWLRAQASPCPWDEGVLQLAAQRGQLEVINWCRAHRCPWSSDVTYWAAYGGQLATLEYLRNPAQGEPCQWSEEACNAAAKGGYVRVLQWMRSQSPPCPWDLEKVRYIAQVHSTNLELREWVRNL
jgi:hypothetical protein